MPPDSPAVDKQKLRSKLDRISNAKRRLETIGAKGRAAFLADEILQAASIRFLQTAVEAMLDIANHVTAREGLGLPTSYRESIEILLRGGLLPSDHGESFLRMVGFRNRVVHMYDDVAAAEVYGIIENDLKDFDAFIRAIVSRYFGAARDH